MKYLFLLLTLATMLVASDACETGVTLGWFKP